MRIVIDMQGAQTASRLRGIGRYTVSLVQGLIRNRRDHEIVLALNGAFVETIEQIHSTFGHLIPRENIRIWHAPEPGAYAQPGDKIRRQRAQLIREAFLASLEPDVIHIASLFEGFEDNAVNSIGLVNSRIPTTVSFYDFIPLHNLEQVVRPHPPFREWYIQQLEYLKRADLLLAISEASAHDARTRLRLPEKKVVNVSTAGSEIFKRATISTAAKESLLFRLGITKPFILVSGTIDEHKILSAFSLLSPALTNGCGNNIASY